MWFLLILPSMATAAPKPSSSSPSSDGSSSLAGLATGVVLGLAFAPQPDCRDVGVRILKRRKNHQRQMFQIDANLCAVLYDEEKCLRSGAFKSLLAGEQGTLPILTRGLRRNDAEVPHLNFMIKINFSVADCPGSLQT